MTEDERHLMIDAKPEDEEAPDDERIERWGYCSECGQVFPVAPSDRPFASPPGDQEVWPVTGTRSEVYDLLRPGFLAHSCEPG